MHVGRQIRCRKAVVVSQRRHAFGNTQQLHEADAAIGTRTASQTGRSGFQLGAQVTAALQGLDDGFGGGAGGGDGAVLRSGAQVGLDHVLVQANTLLGGNCQQAAVFHEEFNMGVAHGTDGLAFLQDVSGLDLAADALLVDCEGGAGTCDGSDRSYLGHDVLQLRLGA